MIALAATLLCGTTDVRAQDVQSRGILLRRPSFDYAQCANVCQMKRDVLATMCLAPTNADKPAEALPRVCSDLGQGAYESCLSVCPVDTGE